MARSLSLFDVLNMPQEERVSKVPQLDARKLGLRVIDGAAGTTQFIGTEREYEDYREGLCGTRRPSRDLTPRLSLR